MDEWDIEAVKKELKRLNPHIEKSVDFDSDPDVKEWLEDLAKHKVDSRYIFNLLDWTQDRQQDVLEGNCHYDETFDESENLKDGAKLILKGCQKIRRVLSPTINPKQLEVFQGFARKNSELEDNTTPEHVEFLKKLKEDTEIAHNIFTKGEDVELLKKLKEVEDAILAHPAYKMKKLTFSKHRPPKYYINKTIVILVDYLQEYFPLKRSDGQVSLKACDYAGFFLICSGLIEVEFDKRFDLSVRKRYLAEINKRNAE